MRLCRLRGGAAQEGRCGDRSKKLTEALVWQLDWGASISTIVAAARGAGIPLSTLPCVQTQVDLFEYLRPEWDAFWALSTDRPVGMAQGAIPWTSIDRYAARYRIERDDFDRFHDLIRALDAAFLSYKKET